MLNNTIRYMRNDCILKKLITMIFLFMFLIGSIFIYSQYKNIKNLYINQIEITERIVGTVVEKYPEDEVEIVKSIYNLNKSKQEIGRSILTKFGYNSENNMTNDDNFKIYLNKFLLSSILTISSIVTLVIVLFLSIMRYVIKNLNKVNFRINNIHEENYLNEECILEEDDNKDGIFGRIYNDIYELEKSLNIKILKLNKEKESIKSLVTDISHQLKTPLASLNLYNTLLLEEDLDEKEIQEFLIINKHSIEKLHYLIDALVNISRLEASMINIKREDNNIKDTLFKAIKSVIPKAKEKNITLDIDDIYDKTILHDKKWTEESIFNILDNSVKYTPSYGNIKISVEETISYFKINIQDNGIGIDKGEFNNIFKRFYRVESSEMESIEGSGVGLYLSRKILEEQGGNIIVSSEVGEGTKFSLFLTTL